MHNQHFYSHAHRGPILGMMMMMKIKSKLEFIHRPIESVTTRSIMGANSGTPLSPRHHSFCCVGGGISTGPLNGNPWCREMGMYYRWVYNDIQYFNKGIPKAMEEKSDKKFRLG